MIKLPKPGMYSKIEEWAERLVQVLEAKFGREAPSGALTVDTLPPVAEAPVGTRFFVTDADDTTFHSVVDSGGSNTVPVFCDGTNWRIG